jgi:uncharacterized protein YbjT (DUF2867 family)
MPTKNAIIVGASGLIGSHLAPLLTAQYSNVISLVRRKSSSATMTETVVDFTQSNFYPTLKTPADCFCCVGTTIKIAGSKDAFRAVDFDLVINFAGQAKHAGATRFFVVSALGANANSGVFYNRVKGEMEAALQAIHFETCAIFRPSLLLGTRAQPRMGERIMEVGFALASPILSIGKLRNIKPIEASVVARAILNAAKAPTDGVHIFEPLQILSLAK